MQIKIIGLRVAMAAIIIAAGTSAALAQTPENRVNNQQGNWAETRARMNADIRSVTQDVTMTAAGIGNSFSAELGGTSAVNNTQTTTAPVSAALNVNAQNAFGSLTATAAAIGNSASVVIDETKGMNPAARGSVVNNNQLLATNVNADLTLTGGNISPGNPKLGIAATAAAIGNSSSVDVAGNLEANNLQRFFGDARSNLNVNMRDVTGDSTLTSAAIANSASYNVTDSRKVTINNTQYANYDPSATSNITLRNINGDLASTTAAISNSLSVSTLPASAMLSVNTNQQNGAGTYATSTINLGEVTGSVTGTAAAIGNSVSITNLPK
ncbi:MAG: hypothetical protein ACOYJ6_19065 [Caulobacterales bacterium]|jgi:phosphoribosylanthranilate isomerase